MRNEPWVWPEVRDAGTSGAGAVPLRSAQLMGQKKEKKKNPHYWYCCFCTVLGSTCLKLPFVSVVHYCGEKKHGVPLSSFFIHALN